MRGFRPRPPTERHCDYCGQLVPRAEVWPLLAEREDDDQVEVLMGRFCAGCRAHLADMGYSLGSA